MFNFTANCSLVLYCHTCKIQWNYFWVDRFATISKAHALDLVERCPFRAKPCMVQLGFASSSTAPPPPASSCVAHSHFFLLSPHHLYLPLPPCFLPCHLLPSSPLPAFLLHLRWNVNWFNTKPMVINLNYRNYKGCIKSKLAVLG